MITELHLQQAKILWDYHCLIDNLELLKDRENTVIIGLGSYDIRVAEYCANLYNQGYAHKILFTGKSGNWTIGKWNKTEAQVFADIAKSYHVPENDIILENNATNLGENVQYSKQLLTISGFIPKQIILVTKPNTTRRAYASHMVYWSELIPLLSAPSIEFNNLAVGYTLNDLISELVGDTERIITYPEKGFQIPQDIPDDVMNAYLLLKKDGYTAHSIKNGFTV